LPLDNGSQIQVAVRVDAKIRSAEIDFTGTSPQQTNNFNAPTAVCMAAVLYVFRSLVNDDIPLNAGCLKPLNVIIPSGCMLNPNFPASVVAGNVETSTCITNALLGALGVMAGSQPTMNNFTFGNAKYQYYETISGGSGAGVELDDDGQVCAGFNGASVVQTHMTNSRLTDPEILEFRFPVRLESYSLRQGSGGAGGRLGCARIVEQALQLGVVHLAQGADGMALHCEVFQHGYFQQVGIAVKPLSPLCFGGRHHRIASFPNAQCGDRYPDHLGDGADAVKTCGAG
jgi:N-methylhydantoinase B/oxoprolinase/acetone carboxylase alpha subunit